MNNFLGPILKGDEVNKILRKRRTPYIYNTVRGKTSKILKEKVELEKEEGWVVSRKNKKSTKMQKPKPPDEQFEDMVWTIVARMGFKELSEGRLFKIKVDHGQERQIDVFAKDDESAVLIECTQSEKPIKKPMNNLIEKIISIQKQVYASIHKHYKDENKHKLKWVIATQNIKWGDADRSKAEANKIVVLTEHELEYFKNLTTHIRTAAKFQFLAHIFANDEISGLDMKVAAIKGKMGGTSFYNFVMKPLDLMKIAYVSHQASQDPNATDTYQRMLKPARLKKIATYIDNGGRFPTNIVLNFKSKKNIRFEKKQDIGDSSFGALHLPKQYASAWVIDGQHRLYGYAYSGRGSGKMGDTSTLPILAFDKLPTTKEIALFIDINHEQVSVPKALLYELVMDQKWESENGEDKLLALRSKVAMSLEVDVTSPLHSKVVISGKKKSIERCITFPTLVDGLEESKLLGVVSNESISPGPISNSNPKAMKSSLRRASEILSQYFGVFKRDLMGHWELSSAKGGYLSTNNGIRALLIVLKEICDHIERESQIKCFNLDVTEFMNEVEKYTTPLIDYFKNAPSIEIQGIKRQSGGLAGVKRQAYLMMEQILKRNSDFGSHELKAFVEKINSEETHEVRDTLAEIETKLFHYVVVKLKNEYGELWWQKRVPSAVQKNCHDRKVDDKHIKEVEQYVCLIDIRNILMHEDNWDLFSKEFSLGENPDSKKNATAWLSSLNRIRNIVFHPPKGDISTEQVNYVRDICPKINSFIS